jgi:hypothetical protein
MSGGGRIIEKLPLTLEDGRDVIRYAVINRYQDEACVYAKPADREPKEGDSIWWGSAQVIWWGPNDELRLEKVGYSFQAPWHNPSQGGQHG